MICNMLLGQIVTLCRFPCHILQLCHNECNGVQSHRAHDYLLNRLFKAQIKENIKALPHWPLWGEFTGDRWILITKASNAENVSIWWRHHDIWTTSRAINYPTTEPLETSDDNGDSQNESKINMNIMKPELWWKFYHDSPVIIKSSHNAAYYGIISIILSGIWSTSIT